MILEDQSDTIKALSIPSTYGKNIKKVTMRGSHIALIFFAGDMVYKLKRAVVYPTVDFSTPEKRKLACIAEMKRSTVYAPHLILGIKPVRRLKNGKIRIGGHLGEEIDTVIVERRILKKHLLDFLLPSPSFDRFETMDLAEHLAELHTKAKTFRSKWGVPVLRNLILSIETTLGYFPELFNPAEVNSLTHASLDMMKQHERLITFRQKTGRVKKCHGDLSLSNIAYDKKKFLFFSPIEYNDNLDCIDTLYDLSYITMDLEMKGLRPLSNILFNHYMSYMNDIEGFPLLPLYQSLRASFRATVYAKTTTLLSGTEKETAALTAKQYFALARHFMADFKSVLIACGGLSGSGKSRIAREIGGLMNPAPGAVILRDDVVKKQITGLAPHQRFNKTLDTPAFEKVVYEVLYQQTATALRTGACVIVDALFSDSFQRKEIEKLAQKMNIPFLGLWMDAPLDIRTERVKHRKRNPSDVHKEDELESQLNLKTGKITWEIVDTNCPKDETMKKVTEILKKDLQLKTT